MENLINDGAWCIRNTHQIETELEEALLEKIEHMEVRIEEWSKDYNELRDRFDSFEKDSDKYQDELRARIEELESSLDSYERE